MKIQSLDLQNFRSHESLHIDFDDGVNLLIGHNGAGKSSILEAIGLALFDGKLRSSNKEAVRYGTKSARITIRFVGSDENEYRVERKIGSSASWSLFFGEEKSARYQGNEQVQQELRKITGVPQNEKRLFSDVICAVQNRFTDIFSQSGTKREETFNLLFETDIYRKIYENFTGPESVTRQYQDEKIRIEENLKMYAETKIDIDAVHKELEESSKKLKVHEKSVVESSAKVTKTEEDRIKAMEAINQCAQLESKISSLTQQSLNLNGSIKESERLIGEAKKSELIVAEKSNDFAKYEQLSAQLHELEKSISDEQEVREQLKSVTNRLEQVQSEITQGKQESAVVQTQIESAQIQGRSQFQERAEIITAVESLSFQQKTVMDHGTELRSITDKYSEQLTLLEQCENEYLHLEQRIVDSNNSQNNTAQIHQELEQVRGSVFQLDQQVVEFKRLELLLTEENTKLTELLRAEHELADGICPILKEHCKNTDSANSASDYFPRRTLELQQMISGIQSEKSRFEPAQVQLDSANRRSAELENELKLISEQERQVNQFQEQLKLLQQKRSLLLEKISLIEPNEQVSASEFSERYESLIMEKTKLGSQSTFLKKEIEEKSGEVEKRTIQITEIEQLIATNQNRLSQLSQQAVSFQNEYTELESRSKSISVILTGYESTRAGINGLAKQLDDLEPSYRLVLENRDLAARVVEFTSQFENSSKELLTVEQDLKKAKENSTLLDKEALQLEVKRLDELRLTESAALDQLKQTVTELTLLNTQLNGQIEEASKQSKKLAQLEEALRVISRKIELTELFRNNVKDMGRFVASGLVENIAFEATTYFQQITGHVDQIEWLVTDDEKYTIYLVSGSGDEQIRREFTVLSGGEQVAVALSLRTAMAQELAGGDFAIFDEPTVNLDSERKVALAESIKSMLGTLQQTIIVTHDDVFREMAQNTIELSPIS